ncbi:helix-turn-helix domain-containing protein [Clostridium pasteurianum]|uniref:Putative transcriptional regulator n=1 Tax=Clostridium pasteurianum BC1 TaxID=86416 RepID=R4K0L5_CLOPA|nr:helix-turn-helix transcriptional regulator [Clostridium pasteurianum]AGK96627.1 putative transcriptional regulator [Clostridium pasteurianum BC1]
MIKTDKDYQNAITKLREDIKLINKQKEELYKLELTDEQVARAVEPLISFHEQLREEVEYYERIKRGDFDTIFNLETLGKVLIYFRIYRGLSQKELADILCVSPTQVSKDERNEYYGASIEKIQRVMNALGMITKTKIDEENHCIISRDDNLNMCKL